MKPANRQNIYQRRRREHRRFIRRVVASLGVALRFYSHVTQPLRCTNRAPFSPPNLGDVDKK